MELEELKTALDEMQETTRDFGKSAKAVEELKGKIEKLEAKMNRPGSPLHTAEDPVSEAKSKMVDFMRTGQGLDEKSLTGSVNPDGGFGVPLEIDRMVQDQLVEISPVRSVANVVTTSSRDYRKLIGRRGLTSGWAGEQSTRSATDTPQLAAVSPMMGEVYSYASITRWLLEDAMFDVAGWLNENVATEFAQEEGAAFINGDGVNKPLGFLSGTPETATDDSRTFGELQYVATGTDGALDGTDPADVLQDTITALKPSYRRGAVWMFNSATAGTLRKIQDGDGRYLWQDSLVEGQPNRLLGYPVVEAEDMPTIASDSFSIAFGNFSLGYIVADRAGLTAVRDEVTQPGWVKFYMARRVGGCIADSNAIKLIKFGTS